MITGELKNRIDSLWEIFWTGGLTNILANSPFKGSLDADIVSADLLKVCNTKKTELLFLALFVGYKL